jgi:mRNA-degrading endonuclease RelE of RelBE toxin-antitoxin system
MKRFRLIASPSSQRQVRKLTPRNPRLLSVVSDLQRTLEIDPYNLSKQHDIKKLTEVKADDGQWRIRSGDYRIQYDVWGDEVALHSFTHRREAY